MFCSFTLLSLFHRQVDKLDIARQRGCDETILWSRDMEEASLVEKTRSKSIKCGFNAVIDFVNNATTAERAFKCLRKVTIFNLF